MTKTTKSRSISRNYRRQMMNPSELLIAGEDFDCAPDDPLRDAQSNVREALDPELLDVYNEFGFFVHVYCVARAVPGYDQPKPVVVDGRRAVRHYRELNRRMIEAGLEPSLATVILLPPGTNTFEMARLHNRNGLAETPKQLVEYVRHMKANSRPDSAIARVLGISESSIPIYEKLGEADASEALLDALDRGMSPVGAALLTKVSWARQEEILKTLGNNPSVSAVRKALRNERAEEKVVRPMVKNIRALLKKEAKDPSMPAAVIEALKWVTGEIDSEAFAALVGVDVGELKAKLGD